MKSVTVVLNEQEAILAAFGLVVLGLTKGIITNTPEEDAEMTIGINEIPAVALANVAIKFSNIVERMNL